MQVRFFFLFVKYFGCITLERRRHGMEKSYLKIKNLELLNIQITLRICGPFSSKSLKTTH